MHVLLGMGMGGVERGVENVALRLQALGLRQSIACLESLGSLGRELQTTLPVWSCQAPASRSRLIVLRRLAALIGAFRPDIIHARNCTAWIYASLAWRLAGSPGRLVFSIHGLDWDGPIPAARIMAYRWLARSTSTLLAVSSATADDFSAASGIPRNRFRVIHSGVDTRVFRPPASVGGDDPNAVCLIGCVARLGCRKGHETLLNAAALLRNRGNTGFRMRIVGDGSQRASLEKLSIELGIADLVSFIGEVHDVPKQLQAMDLFVLPSLSEGRPTSIMEAMASGLPVVATRVGAVATLVKNEITGFVVEPGDVEGLATALGRMIGNAGQRREWGAAGRRLAESEFSTEAMIAAYRQIYQGP